MNSLNALAIFVGIFNIVWGAMGYCVFLSRGWRVAGIVQMLIGIGGLIVTAVTWHG